MQHNLVFLHRFLLLLHKNIFNLLAFKIKKGLHNKYVSLFYLTQVADYYTTGLLLSLFFSSSVSLFPSSSCLISFARLTLDNLLAYLGFT